MEKTNSTWPIPPQLLGEYEKQIGMIFDLGNIMINTTIPANLAITMIIQILWAQLDDMSFLMINMMISMIVPGIA